MGTEGAQAAQVTAGNAETCTVPGACLRLLLAHRLYNPMQHTEILPYRVMFIYICRIHCQVKNKCVCVYVCENTYNLGYKSTFDALAGERVCYGNCWGAAAYLRVASESCQVGVDPKELLSSAPVLSAFVSLVG